MAIAVVAALAACGRLNFDPLQPPTDGDSDSADSADSATAVCGTIVALDDGFDDTAPAPSWGSFSTSANLVVSELAGTMRITYTGVVGPGLGAGYTLVGSVDFTGGCVTFEMTEVPQVTDRYVTIFIEDLGMPMDNMQFEYIDGTLQVEQIAGGVGTNPGGTIPYDAVMHRFLRVRNLGPASFLFESAATLAGPYALLASTTTSPVPANMAHLRLASGTGLVGVTGTGERVQFSRVLVTRP